MLQEIEESLKGGRRMRDGIQVWEKKRNPETVKTGGAVGGYNNF